MALLCIGLVVILFLLSDASESGISLVPSINCSGSNATVGGSFSVFCTYSLGLEDPPCGYNLPYIEVHVPNKATVSATFNSYNKEVEEPLCCIHGPVSIDGGKQCKFNLTSGGNISGSYNMTSFQFTVNKKKSNEVDRRITLYIFNQSDHSGSATPPGVTGPPSSGTTPGPPPSGTTPGTPPSGTTPGPLFSWFGLLGLCIPAAILSAIIFGICHWKPQGKGQKHPASKETMSSKDKPDGGIVLKSYIRRRPHN
jgi:hypothetical protein